MAERNVNLKEMFTWLPAATNFHPSAAGLEPNSAENVEMEVRFTDQTVAGERYPPPRNTLCVPLIP